MTKRRVSIIALKQSHTKARQKLEKLRPEREARFWAEQAAYEARRKEPWNVETDEPQ
jgi:hypothetical protein